MDTIQFIGMNFLTHCLIILLCFSLVKYKINPSWTFFPFIKYVIIHFGNNQNHSYFHKTKIHITLNLHHFHFEKINQNLNTFQIFHKMHACSSSFKTSFHKPHVFVKIIIFLLLKCIVCIFMKNHLYT